MLIRNTLNKKLCIELLHWRYFMVSFSLYIASKNKNCNWQLNQLWSNLVKVNTAVVLNVLVRRVACWFLMIIMNSYKFINTRMAPRPQDMPSFFIFAGMSPTLVTANDTQKLAPTMLGTESKE